MYEKVSFRNILNESSSTAKEIYENGLIEKSFNFRDGLDKLIKEDKTGKWIFFAGKRWSYFDYEKGLDALIEKDKIGNIIIDAGNDWPKFNYEKGLNMLITKDKTGKWVYWAGTEWPKFDYEKGLDILIKKDKTGEWIYGAGKEWPEFDYKKGFNALIKIDKPGIWIYWAGMDWSKFDYKKGLQALKNTNHYNKALENWPKNSAWMTRKVIDQLKQKSQKLPTKKLKLKEWLNESSSTAKEIYEEGLKKKNFNYEKGLDELIKKDESGMWIYWAGMYWPKFNYEKALKTLKNSLYYEDALKYWPKSAKETKEIINQLKKKSKKMPTKELKLKEWLNESFSTAKKIYEEGLKKKNFNYERGLDALIKEDKDGQWIFWAGREWPKFNYEKGFNALIKKDKVGPWVYEAGKTWPKFDYEKGYNELAKKDKNSYWFILASKYWPKSAKETKKIIDKLKQKSQKLPTKKLKLKEEELFSFFEEFKDSVKIGSAIFEIFVNPTPKEIKDITSRVFQKERNKAIFGRKYVRFIADLKHKNIYVFPDMLLHAKASKIIGIPYDVKSGNYIYGAGEVVGNKIKVEALWDKDKKDKKRKQKILKKKFPKYLYFEKEKEFSL